MYLHAYVLSSSRRWVRGLRGAGTQAPRRPCLSLADGFARSPALLLFPWLSPAADAAKNSNPAQDGQSASEVEVALPGSTAAAGSPGVTTGATSEEGLQSLSENVSSGSSSKSESSETGAGPTDSAAQPGGTVGGGVANGAAVEESGSGADADPPSKAEEAADPGPAAATSSKGGASAGPQISSAPSLPPFFKAAPAANDAAATVVAPPTTGAVGEAGAAEVVDGAQIDGVGFAGQAEAAGTGCKCCIM